MTNPAGFWVRFLASFLDGLIIGLPLAVISYFMLGEWDNETFTGSLTMLYTLIVPVVWTGYTIGKKIMGVRIAKVNGEKLGIGTMLLRVVVAGILYAVTFGIAYIASAFMVGIREDKRAIHDLIAGTYVTYNEPELETKFLAKEN